MYSFRESTFVTDITSTTSITTTTTTTTPTPRRKTTPRITTTTKQQQQRHQYQEQKQQQQRQQQQLEHPVDPLITFYIHVSHFELFYHGLLQLFHFLSSSNRFS